MLTTHQTSNFASSAHCLDLLGSFYWLAITFHITFHSLMIPLPWTGLNFRHHCFGPMCLTRSAQPSHRCHSLCILYLIPCICWIHRVLWPTIVLRGLWVSWSALTHWCIEAARHKRPGFSLWWGLSTLSSSYGRGCASSHFACLLIQL